MSWMADLYDTYEQNFNMDSLDFTTDKTPLPISHSTQNAQIEITIDEEGRYIHGEAVTDKEEAVTIIPVTEDSIARASGPCAHPLEDKLEYIAGDYEKYTGKNNDKKHALYVAELSGWCDSDFSCREIEAVRKYIMKGAVIENLVSEGVLKVSDKDGTLTKDTIAGINQRECFVRFSVKGGNPAELYRNKKVFELYTGYYNGSGEKNDFCCVSGEYTVCSQKHGAKIRNGGDKAKLISANDNSGFTYRGRFTEAKQAVSVGYEVSQKAHSALRWIVKRNGFRAGELTIAAWEISGKDIPDIMAEYSVDIFTGEPLENKDIDRDINTEYALRLKKTVNGYRADLGDSSDIVVMGLEAATIGRLSVRFYTKMSSSDFLANIEKWYGSCCWRWGKYIGAPSLYRIAQIAYGSRNSGLLGNTVERLIPCIIENRPLPEDIVRAAVNRVCCRSSYDSYWDWNRDIGMTCALIRKREYDRSGKIHKDKRKEWSMSLDRKEEDRSYLFGRLLGVAHRIETVAMLTPGKSGDVRETSAERYFQKFRQRPAGTWGIVYSNLKPYMARLKSRDLKKYERYEKELEQIHGMFKTADFNDSPLSPLFILGYNCQLNSYSSYNSETQEVNQEVNEDAE